MAQINLDWDELGRNIEDIVDRAVNSHDYQKLEQTIRQTVEKAVDLGGAAVRKAVDSTSRPRPAAKASPVVVEKKDLPQLYTNTNGATAGGIVKIVGGGMLSAFGLVLFFGSLVFDAVVAGAVALGIPAATSLACLIGGGTLIGNGIHGLNRISRFKTYCKTLGRKTVCALEQLAQSVGKSEKYVLKDVQKMIQQGYFRQGHLDFEKTRLITSNETYNHFEQSRLQLEQRKKEEAEAKLRREASPLSPQVQEILDKGDAYVAQIRRCNDLIPGEEISRKISRMETIVERIFDRAEKHPEVIPDLKKLMNYYLPMTIKLLNAYADMDAQPIQGDTIVASKQEIEATLDTLNQAYEKLLDDLFSDTALDVSSDISVLQTLLAQEGLTDDAFKTK